MLSTTWDIDKIMRLREDDAREEERLANITALIKGCTKKILQGEKDRRRAAGGEE